MRRSHDGISAPSFIVEADGTVRRPHRVNLETGLYRGRKVLADAKEEKEIWEDHMMGYQHLHL